MAAGEEEQNKGEGKGFAGLSSLVSDVDVSLPPPAKQEAAGSDASSSTLRPTASQNAQPEPQPTQQQPYQAPSQPSSGSSTGKWVLGIAAVIGVLWFIGEADKSPSSPAPSYSPPAPSTAPSYSAVPAQPQVPSRPDETKPPVGQDLVFSTAQIMYCLAEDIRMDAAKAVLNNYSDSDVDRFNAMVADYNSRCGSFRYRSGALESARRDVEPYRSQLQAEGRSRFARSPSTGSLSAPTLTRPAADETVRAIQRKLNELGYDAGGTDGLMGNRTRSAILAFQRDMGLTPDGRPDADLLTILNSASTATSTGNAARPNRAEPSEQNAAPSSRAAPTTLPPQNVQPSSATRDAKNFRLCVSGQYPSLCNYALLTPDEATQVAAAERRVNFQTCISGNYPSLCKHSLLTSDQAVQVAAAERRVNFQTCISGQYPSLCKHSLLTPDESARVAEAERRAGKR